MELAGLSWSDDGKVLAWSRGGGEHNPWANGLAPPNPASAVDQPKLEIWASVGGGKPKLVGEGEEPTVSPTGRIAYLKEGRSGRRSARRRQAREAVLRPRQEQQPCLVARRQQARLRVAARRPQLHWRLCRTRRADHLARRPQPRSTRNPAWSPDGTPDRLLSPAGDADLLALPLVEKPSPFSIWCCHVADGEARRIVAKPSDAQRLLSRPA